MTRLNLGIERRQAAPAARVLRQRSPRLRKGRGMGADRTSGPSPYDQARELLDQGLSTREVSRRLIDAGHPPRSVRLLLEHFEPPASPSLAARLVGWLPTRGLILGTAIVVALNMGVPDGVDLLVIVVLGLGVDAAMRSRTRG